jgi:hypothetical protein
MNYPALPRSVLCAVAGSTEPSAVAPGKTGGTAMITKSNTLMTILAIVLGVWTTGHSQDQNALALRQYTWKSQTQIRKEGEVKATKLYSSRYAADGSVVQLLLEEESARPPKFGIRGAVARKKKEEAQKLIEALQALAKSYGELPPAKMQEFMKSARASLETNAPQPLLRLESRILTTSMFRVKTSN